MRTALTIALSLTLASLGACKKEAPEAAASSNASASRSASAAVTAEMPDSKEARNFANKLVETTVTNWEPTSSGSDTKFEYLSMTFQPDGTWGADAELEASFEKIPCKESGKWSIIEMSGSNSATMSWTIDSTNCPMREANQELRIQMELPKANDWQISFR